MAKKIVSVGFQLASKDVSYSEFHEKTSLLDWDIILFRPTIDTFVRTSASYSGHDYYNGKICLNDTQSFRAKEACAHWRRELLDAVDSGKTVIAHLNSPNVVYVATGTTSTSGTGKNQKVTRHVTELSSYDALPTGPNPTETQGFEMALRPEYREILASYWERFKDHSNYEVVFPKETKGCCISTKHGNRPVGIYLSSKSSSGSLLLLPDVDFYQDVFFEEQDEEYSYSKVGIQFASEYVSEVVSLDKNLRKSSEKTPEPDWAKSSKYALTQETGLREKLLQAEAKLEEAQRLKETVAGQLSEAGRLRDLLFETGKPLEFAILRALEIMGFEASGFEDQTSEFDAVFESEEGRLIGEAEGKDNKAIAIGKLRQLSTNIHEDLEREEVTRPAKGILFGNAYRLRAPEDREDAFTDKCITSAHSMSIGLVSTPDLFRVAKYLSDNDDDDFAKGCRAALISGIGSITFPDPPEIGAPPIQTDSELSSDELSSA